MWDVGLNNFVLGGWRAKSEIICAKKKGETRCIKTKKAIVFITLLFIARLLYDEGKRIFNSEM